MKPKEYVKKYHLDKNAYFAHNDFIADLSNDFFVTIEYLQSVNQLSYNRYKVCVKEIKQKYDIIMGKSIVEKEVWDKLWKYFFATIVAPAREKIFADYLSEQKAAYEKRQRQYQEQWKSFRAFSFFDFYASMLSHLLKDKIPIREFQVLDISVDSSKDEIKSRYRILAKESHPDMGGSRKLFEKYTAAKNKCLAYAQGRQNSI